MQHEALRWQRISSDSARRHACFPARPSPSSSPHTSPTCRWLIPSGRKIPGRVVIRAPGNTTKDAPAGAAAAAVAAAAAGDGSGSSHAVVLVCMLDKDAQLHTGGKLMVKVNGRELLVYEEEASPGYSHAFAVRGWGEGGRARWRDAAAAAAADAAGVWCTGRV